MLNGLCYDQITFLILALGYKVPIQYSKHIYVCVCTCVYAHNWKLIPIHLQLEGNQAQHEISSEVMLFTELDFHREDSVVGLDSVTCTFEMSCKSTLWK